MELVTMGLVREHDSDISTESFPMETMTFGAQDQTGLNDQSDAPNWTVLDNPIYSLKAEDFDTEVGCRALRIVTTKELHGNRSEVEKNRLKCSTAKCIAVIDGGKRLERSNSAPAARDGAKKTAGTKLTRKIPERRYRSRLKESDVFRTGFVPLWEYFASTMIAFGRNLFPNTSNLGDAVCKS